MIQKERIIEFMLAWAVLLGIAFAIMLIHLLIMGFLSLIAT